MSKREIEDGEVSDDDVVEIKKPKTDDFDCFVIDTFSTIISTEEQVAIDSPTKEAVSPSKWSESVKRRFLGDEVETPGSGKKPVRKGPICFNCDGAHVIRDCPEPRNLTKIRQATLAYQNNQTPNGRSRYHADDTEPSKFKPGRLSSSLRDACGIGPDDIPDWVYRMRRMGYYKGYPPGYLKKALKEDDSHSILKIHSDTAKKLTDEEMNKVRPAPIVDAARVHYYMGFNKNYGALNDIESWYEIPQFEEFIANIQKDVEIDHKVSEDHRLLELKNKPQNDDNGSSSNKQNEDIDVMIIEATEEVKEEKAEKKETSEDDDQTAMEDSISQIIGTPIIGRRAVDGTYIQQSLPDIDKFSVGIVPFEAREESVGQRGIFKRIMSTIKNLTGTKSDQSEKE